MEIFRCISLSLTALLSASAVAMKPPEPASQVMLQGESSAALAALVRDNGGEITHLLPIIDAVGAKLTDSQLQRVVASPLVQRHIDDLDIEPNDSEPEQGKQENTCDVAGGLQLQISDEQVTWPLFNKSPAAARLESISVDWPTVLGAVTAVTFAGTDITPQPIPEQETSELNWQYPSDEAPELVGEDSLTMKFRREGPAMDPAEQSDFEIVLKFEEGCEVKLVPAYADNANNTYFPAATGADLLHRHGVTGRGVTVAILDSGLWEHPALLNDTNGTPRIVARYDATTGTTPEEAYDESGHGTHMASILAHSGSVDSPGIPPGSYKGIAPDSNLVVVKAFKYDGKADLLDLVRGVQYVVDHQAQFDIRVLNLSFAARPRWPYWLDPVNQALMKAWAHGITVIAAAGNEGPDPMTIGSPGNLPYLITVGAVTDSWTPATRDDDYIPDFSSRGPTPSGHIKPDLVAPGGHMTGLTRPGSMLADRYPEYLLESGDFVMTGTSQAAALVSGAVALLLQLLPDLTPDDIKCKLTSSAEPAINNDGFLAYSPFTQGSGYLSITRAITLGETGCENRNMDIAGDIEGRTHFSGPAVFKEGEKPALPGLGEIYAGSPSEKGMSKNRKWGVKEHVERLGREVLMDPGETQTGWLEIYRREKALMEALATGSAQKKAQQEN